MMRSYAIAMSVGLWAVAQADAQAEKPPASLTAQIKASWQARERKFKSVEMKWTSVETFYKGGISASLPSGTESKLAIQPPEDTTFNVSYDFKLEGNKTRLEWHGWQWYTSEGRFNKTRWLTVYDGRETRECHLEREGEQRWPEGIVTEKFKFSSASQVFMLPVCLFFRPVSSEFKPLNIASYRPVGNARIRNYECAALQNDLGLSSTRIWIDPKRDSLVVRRSSYSQGKLALQIDIGYGEDAKWGWVPVSWTVTSMRRDGVVSELLRVKVDLLNINDLADKTDFELVFPPGSIVNDTTNNSKWIVNDSGTKWIIPPRSILQTSRTRI
ncbi:MAG: hypothetical protein SNJ75_18335 [Gemmataceae bacterium]